MVATVAAARHKLGMAAVTAVPVAPMLHRVYPVAAGLRISHQQAPDCFRKLPQQNAYTVPSRVARVGLSSRRPPGFRLFVNLISTTIYVDEHNDESKT